MGKEESNFDVSRAEFFEAMGHPTRIRILKALETGPLGFSELKRSVGVESNGLLAFHLGKMKELVREGLEGKYALSDLGVEALRLPYVLEKPTQDDGRPLRVSRTSSSQHKIRWGIVGGLVIALLVVAAFAAIMYAQSVDQSAAIKDKDSSIAALQSSLSAVDGQIAGLYKEIASLESNQTASQVQVNTLKLEVSQLQDAAARLSLELSVAQQWGKVSVLAYYINSTMIVPGNSTVPLGGVMEENSGTVVFVFSKGCPNVGASGGNSTQEYDLYVLLTSRGAGGPGSIAVTNTISQPFNAYLKNIGASSVQCTFSLFYVFKTS